MRGKAIFLSAGVPEGERARNYPEAEPFLINSAIRAFVEAALGRRLIIWGGQPAITSMFLGACQGLTVDYQQWVFLYQSRFFEGKYPKINEYFNRWEVDAKPGDLPGSLKLMRQEMMTRQTEFYAGVFIGGMEGIEDEYKMFRLRHPNAKTVLVLATGGATLKIAKRRRMPATAIANRKFSSLFYNELEIGEDEPRGQVILPPHLPLRRDLAKPDPIWP